MTPAIAQDLSKWYERSVGRPGSWSKLNVHLAAGLSTSALDYLLDRHSSCILRFTQAGMGVDCAVAELEYRSAQALLDARKLDPPVPAPAPSIELDLAPPPKSQHYGVPWTICDAGEAENRLAVCPPKSLEQKRLLEKLSSNADRALPQAIPAHIDQVRTLIHDFPHFRPAIDEIARHLLLQVRTGAALRLSTLLLLGPPGVGKTEFGRRLGQVLPMHFAFHSLADLSGHFLLTGNSSGWTNGGPGLVAKLVAACPDGRAPLLMLDELDKVRTEGSFPTDTALLGLLERRSAQIFRDECLDLVLDASPVSCLLTANRLDGLRPEIVSRLRVLRIPPPTAEQMPAVIRSIDRSMREETPALDEVFAALSQSTIESLAGQPPRLIKRLLEETYAGVLEDSAESDAKLVLLPEHFPAWSRKEPEQPRRRSAVPSLLVVREGWQWLH